MARTLYRIYLYFVFTQLLNFSAVVSGLFLGAALQQAASYSQPYSNPIDLRQPAVLAVVALVITAIFGGLHYSLIRRDIAHDPGAARGAVRSFFLNYTEAFSAIIVTVAGGIGFTQLGNSNKASVFAFGLVISFGVLFVLLEIERRRGQPDRGGALVLQRLNYYLIQLILFFIAIGFLVGAIGEAVNHLLITTGYAQDPCASNPAQYGTCYYDPSRYIGDAWLGAAWTVLIWAVYGWLARGDIHSILRAVFRYLAFNAGLGYLFFGVAQGLHTLFQKLLGAPAPGYPYYGDGGIVPYYSAVAQFSFVPLLLVGIAVTLVYWLWLRSDAAHGGVMKPETNHQTSLAIFGAASAGFFWVGLALTLGGIIERAVPGGVAPTADTWALDFAVILAGLVYIPTALWLGALARRTGVSVPRRGFVYYQLAYGTLGALLSLIFVLYAFVSNAIGTPLDHWQQLARQGVANIVIGAIIVGIYVFLARREGWFARQPASAEAATPAPAHLETVESVLDDLLAQRVSRDEAAARVRALTTRTTQ